MNNKLPIEVKEDNIFKKIFSYIKNIFNKKDEHHEIKESIKNKDDNEEFYKLKEKLMKNNNQYVQKRSSKKIMDEIIELVEENPDMLEKLDIEKLEIIDRYYEQRIIECKEILNKRKAKQ